MHLATRKLPLLVPLLEPVCPHDAFPRTWNLLPCRSAFQYSTPNGTPWTDRETAPVVLRAEEKEDAPANGLHADEHDVKPDGTRRNRTSLAANDAPAGRVRNSRDENRECFPQRYLGDGPRGPPLVLGLLLVADEHAPDSGTLVGGGVPCPARLPDTAARHTRESIFSPPCYRPCYSSATKNEGARTIARTPSRDKFAGGNGMGLAVPANCDHAE